MLLNKHWTFSELNNIEWVNEVFEGKTDAMLAGWKKLGNVPLVVGQLIWVKEDNIYIINNEELIYPILEYKGDM